MEAANVEAQAEVLFSSAVVKVESDSIRAWANSDHNRPVWVEIAGELIANGKADADRLALMITCEAMGL